MNTIKAIFLFFFLSTSVFSFAQKPKIISGMVSNLRGIEKVNVKFDFSDWTFYNKNISEKEYVSRRMKDITAKKGDAEAKDWHRDWLQTRYLDIPKGFLNRLNEKFDGKIQFGQKLDTKYELIVHVEWTYPGYFSVVLNKPAKATTSLEFIKKGSTETSLLKLHFDKLKGRMFKGARFLTGMSAANTNNRIMYSFATTGYYLGKFLDKELN